MELLKKRRRISVSTKASRKRGSRRPTIVHVDGSVYKVQTRKLTKVGHNKTGTNVVSSKTVASVSPDMSSPTGVKGAMKPLTTKTTTDPRQRNSVSPFKRPSPKTIKSSHKSPFVTSTKHKKKEAAVAKNKKHCLYFTRFGKCAKIDTCQYLHDPARVAVCTRFLRGTCRLEDC